MALSQIQIAVNIIEGAIIGHQAVSLTHYDDDLECELAQGSIVEVGGALFEAQANESIAGWGGIANNNDVYIKLTAVGNSATASFTTAAPTWHTARQAWYNGNDRYIGGLYKDGSGNYTLKWLYSPADNAELPAQGKTRPIRRKILEIGDWNMDANDTTAIAHGLPKINKIRTVQIAIRRDDDAYMRPLETFTDSMQGGIYSIASINVTMARKAGGIFDNSDYDSVGFNRGWVTIEYEA